MDGFSELDNEVINKKESIEKMVIPCKSREIKTQVDKSERSISLTSLIVPEYKANDLYFLENSNCTFSLFLFSKRNLIRRFCHRIVFNKKFENLILLTIFLAAFKLTVDTYLEENQYDFYLDMVFSIIFLLESLMKIIAQGFILHKDSYLKENWNKLINRELNLWEMLKIRLLRNNKI